MTRIRSPGFCNGRSEFKHSSGPGHWSVSFSSVCTRLCLVFLARVHIYTCQWCGLCLSSVCTRLYFVFLARVHICQWCGLCRWPLRRSKGLCLLGRQAVSSSKHGARIGR